MLTRATSQGIPELDSMSSNAWRARQGKFALGGAVGVVKRSLRRSTFCDVAKIPNRERRIESLFASVQMKRADFDERCKVTRTRDLSISDAIDQPFVRTTCVEFVFLTYGQRTRSPGNLLPAPNKLGVD
jgi:hypothetical protein